MSSSVGLLDFYVTDASEHLDEVEGLLATSGAAGPDPARFVASARAAHASASMARVPRITDLASLVDRIARLVREGTLPWTSELGGHVAAAVADLRRLLRAVRTWGPDEERTAAARIAELHALLPRGDRPMDSMTQATSPEEPGFTPAAIASEAAAIAAAIAAFVVNPIDRRPLADAVRRSRSVRASAGRAAPIPNVAAALDRVGSTLIASPTMPSPAHLHFFGAAVRALRRAAAELRAVGRPDPLAPEVQAFVATLREVDVPAPPRGERVVPISELFFDGPGPHIVSHGSVPAAAAEVPPRDETPAATTAAAAAEAPTTDGPATRQADAEDAGREERELERGRRIDFAIARGLAPLEPREPREPATTTETRDRATPPRSATPPRATTPPRPLTPPRGMTPSQSVTPQSVAAQSVTPPRSITPVRSATPARSLTPPAISPIEEPPTPPVMVPPTPPAGVGAIRAASAPKRATPPRGQRLREALAGSIAELRRLDEEPLAAPAPLDDQDIVPIETLLYSGRAALSRALALRDELRATVAPDLDRLNELYDLLDLAARD